MPANGLSWYSDLWTRSNCSFEKNNHIINKEVGWRGRNQIANHWHVAKNPVYQDNLFSINTLPTYLPWAEKTATSKHRDNSTSAGKMNSCCSTKVMSLYHFLLGFSIFSSSSIEMEESILLHDMLRDFPSSLGVPWFQLWPGIKKQNSGVWHGPWL